MTERPIFDNLQDFRAFRENRFPSGWSVTRIQLDLAAGSEITNTIADAIALSGQHQYHYDKRGPEVVFKFNDIKVTVKDDSDPNLILRDWRRGLLGSIKSVGPYPKEELSPEEIEADALIVRNRQIREHEQSARYHEEEAKRLSQRL